jgi:hypothetical protein
MAKALVGSRSLSLSLSLSPTLTQTRRLISSSLLLQLSLLVCIFVLSASSTLPKLNIAIVDFDSRQNAEVQLVEGNHRRYAESQGYGYVHGTDVALAADRAPHWAKIPMVQNTLEKFDWVLWVDADSMFVNHSLSIEEVLDMHGFFERDNMHPVSLVFSGDSNVINTGVLLFKKSNWTTQLLSEVWEIGGVHYKRKATVGMGLDNAAFAIYFGGCTASDSIDEMKSCYSKTDAGYQHPEIATRIRSADLSVFKKVIPAEVLPNTLPLPQIWWNVYTPEEARFVYHLAGEDSAHKAFHIKKFLSGPHHSHPQSKMVLHHRDQRGGV